MGLEDIISKSSFSRPSGRLASRVFVRLCLKGLQDSPQNSCRFSSFDYNIGPPVGESFKYPKERMNDEFTMSNVIVTRHMTMLRRYFEPELLFRRTLTSVSSYYEVGFLSETEVALALGKPSSLSLEPCCFYVAPAAWLWVRCFSSICETAVIYLLSWTSCAMDPCCIVDCGTVL